MVNCVRSLLELDISSFDEGREDFKPERFKVELVSSCFVRCKSWLKLVISGLEDFSLAMNDERSLTVIESILSELVVSGFVQEFKLVLSELTGGFSRTGLE